MKNKYTSLRVLIWRHKNNPDLKFMVSTTIFRWAKDKNLSLSDFAFLTKKALNYLKPLNEHYL